MKKKQVVPLSKLPPLYQEGFDKGWDECKKKISWILVECSNPHDTKLDYIHNIFKKIEQL